MTSSRMVVTLSSVYQGIRTNISLSYYRTINCIITGKNIAEISLFVKFGELAYVRLEN